MRWPWKKNTVHREWVALHFNQRGLGAVRFSSPSQTTQPQLHQCDYFPDCKTSIAQQEVLTNWVKTQALQKHPCTWVLSSENYQLLSIDSLNVPAEELIPAVRWRIKDLLNYPVENAVIDVFAIPPHGRNQQHKKSYVVAAPLNEIQSLAQMIQYSGLQLTHINIPELTQIPLIAALQSTSQTIGIMTFHADQCELLICRENKLYLARQFDLAVESLTHDAENTFENVWLEAQRSFDYCETQLGLDPPSKLFIMPIFDTYEALSLFLKERISSEVIPLSMERLIQTEKPFSLPITSNCFFAISGGFARYWENHHVT